MISITQTVDDAGLRQALGQLTGNGRDLRPAMESIGAMLMLSTDQRFETQTDPDGKPWTPVTNATYRRKEAAGRELILQWSGRLRGSITRAVDAVSVTVGTNVEYGRIHQLGGTIEREEGTHEIFRRFIETGTKGGDVRRELLPGFVKKSKANFASSHAVAAYSITIPARPYLGINDQDRLAGEEILRRHLMGTVH